MENDELYDEFMKIIEDKNIIFGDIIFLIQKFYVALIVIEVVWIRFLMLGFLK